MKILLYILGSILVSMPVWGPIVLIGVMEGWDAALAIIGMFVLGVGAVAVFVLGVVAVAVGAWLLIEADEI